MGKFLKNTIIFIVIIAVLGIAYYFLVASKSTISNTGSTNSGLQSSTTGAPVSNIIQEQSISSVDANRISQEFVNQLLNLKAIKLDAASSPQDVVAAKILLMSRHRPSRPT